MAISATTNNASIYSQRGIEKSSETNAKAIAELASGSRIVRASDGAAESAIGARLSSTMGVLTQASRNTSQGASLIQVAADSLRNISNVLTRLKTLTSQVINGSLSDADKMMAREEFLKLRDFIDNISTQTRWNGVSMLTGGAGNAILARTAVSLFDGSGNAITDTGNVSNAFAALNSSNLTGTINGKVSTVTIENYTNGVVNANDILVTMENGEVFKNQGVVQVAANGTFTLTSTSNSQNTMTLTFESSVSAITSSQTFATNLQTLLTQSNTSFGGTSVQNVGTSAAKNAVTSYNGYTPTTYGFNGTVKASNGIDATVTTVTNSSVTLIAAGAGVSTITSSAGNFSTVAKTGNVSLANFTANSAYSNGSQVSFMIGTEIYTNTTALSSANTTGTTTFTSTTNAGRTITFTNGATAPTTPAAFAIALNALTNISDTSTGADVSYGASEFSITLSDGSTYNNATEFTPTVNGTLTLTNTTDSTKTITLNLDSNITGLTTNSAEAKTAFTTTLTTSTTFATSNSGGITVNGLAADATYGFTSPVTSSTGFISGIATNASVTPNGSKFEVTVTVGNQVYTNAVDLPTNNGTLELVSTTDGENKLVFQYGSQTASAVTDGVTFNTTLLNFLGLQNGTAPAQFKPDSGATGGITGLDGILSGGSAAPGKYALSYKPDGSGLSGILKLSDGINIYEQSVSSGGKQVVLFSNGVSAMLGASFHVDTPLSQRIFDINLGGGLQLDFQVAELSTDVLTVKLPAVTLTALNMVNADINTQAAAQAASALIDQAMDSVNKSYANLGAQQKQLEVNKEILSSNIINMQAAISEFIDADVPEAMTRMTSSSVQYQIASAMLVQANERTQQLLTMTR